MAPAHAQKILMSPPDFYDTHFMFNPWISYRESVGRPRAIQQWEALVDQLQGLGACVEFLDANPASPAQVFTADGAVALGNNHFLVLRNDGVRGDLEHEVFSGWLKDHGYQTEQLPPRYRLDGGNIVRLADGSYAVGLKPAATGKAERYFERLLRLVSGNRLIQLRLVQRKFLHLDMVLGRLGDWGYLVFNEGFVNGSDALDALASGVPVIPITAEDAARLACNGVTVGDTYVTSPISAALRKEIQSLGMEVAEVDVSEFHKAGGGVKCLTLPV